MSIPDDPAVAYSGKGFEERLIIFILITGIVTKIATDKGIL
jgi:hypothetical protein